MHLLHYPAMMYPFRFRLVSWNTNPKYTTGFSIKRHYKFQKQGTSLVGRISIVGLANVENLVIILHVRLCSILKFISVNKQSKRTSSIEEPRVVIVSFMLKCELIPGIAYMYSSSSIVNSSG